MLPPDSVFSLEVSEAEPSGRRAFWDSWYNFPQNQRYLSGAYTCQASYGSKNGNPYVPYIQGQSSFQITGGETAEVTIRPTLQQAVVQVSLSQQLRESFAGISAMLHSDGGSFVEAPDSFCFMNPGHLQSVISIPWKGNNVNFVGLEMAEVSPSTFYNLSMDYDPQNQTLTISGPEESKSLKVDEDFLSSPAPWIQPVGFEPGTTLKIPEGLNFSTPTQFLVGSETEISNLILSTDCQQLNIPAESDLLALSPAQIDLYASKGIKITREGTHNVIVDLNQMLSSLVYIDPSQAQSSFSLIAIGANGKLSQPVTLKVETLEVGLKVVSVSKALVGSGQGEIIFEIPEDFNIGNLEINVSDDNGRTYQKSPILATTELEQHLLGIKFAIPQTAKPVLVKIYYCQELRHSVTIERYEPSFSIEVDAYATRAIVKIVSPKSERLDVLTQYAQIYVNGKEGSIYARDKQSGTIEVIGLEPDTRYSFKASALTDPAHEEYTPSVEVVTEPTPQLPNSNFEEVKNSISWKNMPCGGKYSQNSVEIFNCQNHYSFDHKVPVKGWATVNAKTFCTKAKNPNTWYLQPSTFTSYEANSGAYAVEMVSVAYDPDGEAIKNYQQTQPPYIKYSREIPNIRYRAAGRLFLGEYSFNPVNMTEQYSPGISWKARPLSLNGFYKYTPASVQPDDKGLAQVTVYGDDHGKEITIGYGQVELPLAVGYTAFSVPVEYQIFGVKASRISVTFASSSNTGTISEESREIKTLDDPVAARSLGSRLTVDNILLAY